MRTSKIHLTVVVRHLVGGIRTYLRYVYARLDPALYRITLVTVRGAETAVLTHDLAIHALSVLEVDHERPMLALTAALRRQLRRDPADVVHAHGFSAASAVAAVNALPSRPVVVTSHDVIDAHPLQEPLGRLKRVVLLCALARSTVVQSVSWDAQHNLLAALPSLHRHRGLLVIPNGVATDVFGRTQDGETADDHAVTTFLFAGRPMPQKGFVDIIAATQSLQESGLPFRVVVCSEGAFLKQYQAEIERRGLTAFFEFPGFSPEIAPLLDRAHAQLMPSLWEACPLAAMESLVAGCPLVASTCIGLREVVAGTPALTVSPSAPRELAGAMAAVIRDRAAFKHAAMAYRPIAAERFDVSRTAAALDQVLKRLAGRGNS